VLEIEAIVTEKLYAKSRGRPTENFALLDKIRKFLRIISSLATISLGCMKTPCGDGFNFGTVCSTFIVEGTYDSDCPYVKPFRSYALPIDGGPRNLSFFPAKFLRVREKNF